MNRLPARSIPLSLTHRRVRSTALGATATEPPIAALRSRLARVQAHRLSSFLLHQRLSLMQTHAALSSQPRPLGRRRTTPIPLGFRLEGLLQTRRPHRATPTQGRHLIGNQTGLPIRHPLQIAPTRARGDNRTITRQNGRHSGTSCASLAAGETASNGKPETRRPQ